MIDGYYRNWRDNRELRRMPASHPRRWIVHLRDLFDVMLLQQAAIKEGVLVDLFFEIPAERRPAFEPRSVRVKSNQDYQSMKCQRLEHCIVHV